VRKHRRADNSDRVLSHRVKAVLAGDQQSMVFDWWNNKRVLAWRERMA